MTTPDTPGLCVKDESVTNVCFCALSLRTSGRGEEADPSGTWGSCGPRVSDRHWTRVTGSCEDVRRSLLGLGPPSYGDRSGERFPLFVPLVRGSTGTSGDRDRQCRTTPGTYAVSQTHSLPETPPLPLRTGSNPIFFPRSRVEPPRVSDGIPLPRWSDSCGSVRHVLRRGTPGPLTPVLDRSSTPDGRWCVPTRTRSGPARRSTPPRSD